MFEDKEEPKSSDGPGFDMEEYLDHYGIRWRKETAGDSTKYILLDGCLFNQEHKKGKDAAIFLRANGAPGYHCFHDGCSDKHWADAKRAISGDDSLAAFVSGARKNTGDKQHDHKPDPTDLSVFISVSSLLDVDEPNRPDLWEGEIPQGSLVGISGLWGSMKSYLMQALGLRAAQGQSFLGRRLVEADVFYFDLENPRDVWKRRLLDLAGQSRPERFHMMTLFGPFLPPPFDSDGIAFYNKLAELHPGSLFIFDSLVRFYPRGKQTENTEDSIHAMTTLKALTRWVTIVFLHHPTKERRDFRGGGDLQAAPDLLFTLKHDKKAKRLTLECTKNRFEEEHTLEIGYEPTPDGGLVFVDMATAEEMKRRAKNREQTVAVLEIIKELYPKGESTKRRLLEEGKKRLNLSRRIFEPVIDNGVGVTWTCTKLSTKHVYAPFLAPACTDDMYTRKSENAENACHDKENERVHDEKTAFVHDEHNPSVSVHSVYTPYKGVHAGTKGEVFEKTTETNSEDFPREDDDQELNRWNY